jgi:type VI secretion system secreted protein Hcp
MIHLEISTIKGDGKTDGFLDQIDCQSFQWGAQNSADGNTPDGLTRASSQVQQISLSSMVGKQSVNMLKAATISQHIPEAKIHFTKTAGGDVSIEWMTLTLTNVVVSSCSISSSAEDMGFESYSLAFQKFEAKYFLIDVGGDKTNGPDLTYDVMARKVL